MIPPDEPRLVPGLAIRSSQAPEFGLPASRVRRRDVEHPFHGVSGVALDTAAIFGRCRSFEPLLLPGQFFSHTTAALLYGAPLSGPLAQGDLDVSVMFPRTPPRGRGISGHRVTSVVVKMLSGLPIASAPDVFCQLGASLPGPDLVAVGDSFVTGRRRGRVRTPALCHLDDLRRATETHRNKRGAARVAWALDRVRMGADSRPETLLRLLLVDAGLPEPELNVEVDVGFNIHLHPDLAFPARKIAFEYEGDHHRVKASTWRSDIERRELFEAAGWRVIRVTAQDVFGDVDAFVARVRRIIAAR